jgi:FMN phosphatase YigB (HAD superfamily)
MNKLIVFDLDDVLAESKSALADVRATLFGARDLFRRIDE